MAAGVPGTLLNKETIWMQAYDPSVALPGNATAYTCRIHVPFKHRLVSAKLTTTDHAVVGSLVAALMQADDGDAKAGTIVGSTATLVATADVNDESSFTLAQVDKVPVAAGRTYHLRLVGTNSGDLADQPVLAIEVQETPRVGV